MQYAANTSWIRDVVPPDCEPVDIPRHRLTTSTGTFIDIRGDLRRQIGDSRTLQHPSVYAET